MAKITVGWAPYLYDSTIGLQFFVKKPESLYNINMKGGEHKYKQCPATKNLACNTFVVSSPFDAHFLVDADKQTLEFIPPHTMPFEFFNMRKGQYGSEDQPILSLNYHQIFVTEHEGVEATITAPWFEETQNNYRVIPGRFMISDWWRPVDFAIQLRTRQQVVRIKRGDPLYYVTFSTKDPDDIVIMREFKFTNDLIQLFNATVDSKFYQPRCPLKNLYSAFRQYTARKHRPKLEFID